MLPGAGRNRVSATPPTGSLRIEARRCWPVSLPLVALFARDVRHRPGEQFVIACHCRLEPRNQQRAETCQLAQISRPAVSRHFLEDITCSPGFSLPIFDSYRSYPLVHRQTRTCTDSDRFTDSSAHLESCPRKSTLSHEPRRDRQRIGTRTKPAQ